MNKTILRRILLGVFALALLGLPAVWALTDVRVNSWPENARMIYARGALSDYLVARCMAPTEIWFIGAGEAARVGETHVGSYGSGSRNPEGERNAWRNAMRNEGALTRWIWTNHHVFATHRSDDFHHHAVHEGGIRIEKFDDGALRFVKPNGMAIDGVAPGTQPMGDWKLPRATTVSSYRGDRTDLSLAVDVFIQQTKRATNVPAGTS